MLSTNPIHMHWLLLKKLYTLTELSEEISRILDRPNPDGNIPAAEVN